MIITVMEIILLTSKVSTTQQLIISLIVPESNLSEELNEPEQVYGCVSAVVGFRF